jgi:hypothetical protein
MKQPMPYAEDLTDIHRHHAFVPGLIWGALCLAMVVSSLLS